MAVNLPPAPAVHLLLGSLPLLILSETNSFHTGHALFKIFSSIAFVSDPLLRLSADPSPYHVLITSGLLFSVLGDILLIPSRKEYYGLGSESGKKDKPGNSAETDEAVISVSFQLGIVAFAAAHIAYILAFLRDSPENLSWPSFATVFVATMAIARWLGVIYPTPRLRSEVSWTNSNVLNLSVPKDMRFLVLVYAVIISSMLAVTVSTTSSLQHQRVLGAVMFVISDIFVAKDAFGKKLQTTGGAEKKRNWWLQTATGWGLYFWGQMVLAGTV
ncbi:predicted protein [Uncinocarpus reesii 1704]|uniref:YhhN domain-containing protein n=1 Tax=Uncinocarpus reesii (strain UAMH 1704) TaxID=336963 RepID=C4JUQ2_UNCRE|nr:uncharacterized protein UREG_04855 [Uncinocarpus reesii 1704]EEP80013.1 predicted protein [Uncinocarpus reesii 1704]